MTKKTGLFDLDNDDERVTVVMTLLEHHLELHVGLAELMAEAAVHVYNTWQAGRQALSEENL